MKLAICIVWIVVGFLAWAIVRGGGRD